MLLQQLVSSCSSEISIARAPELAADQQSALESGQGQRLVQKDHLGSSFVLEQIEQLRQRFGEGFVAQILLSVA